MTQKVYIGNMSYDTTESKLQEMFAAHGEVASVSVVTDRYTGRPRGFAFVEMVTDEAAQAAITALNGQEVDGRQLTVNKARPSKPPQGDRGRRDRRGSDRGRSRW
jgi:cold-inducible RNA-binding protein